MNTDYLLCTTEQFDKLKNLGVKINHALDRYSAQDLLSYLPSFIFYNQEEYFLKFLKGKNGFLVAYETQKTDVCVNAEGNFSMPSKSLYDTYRSDKNFAKALASMLILILENNVHSSELLNVGRLR